MTKHLPLLLAAALLVAAGVAVAQDHDAHGHSEAIQSETTHATEAVDAHAEHAGDHAEHHDKYHLPNLVAVLFGDLATRREELVHQIFAAISAVILMLVLTSAAVRRAERPGRYQVAVEMLMGGLDNLVREVVGPEGRRFTPYLGTLFLFIWINNLLGLVPFGHSATSAINTTASLAICTFLYVQFIGLKENGFLGYLHHMAGSPKSGIEWAFVPLMFPLHLLGEFIKPMSLSLRLFGNVMGEDKLIAVFVVLGASMLSFTHAPIGIPIQVPIVFLALLTSTIQALVFTLLSTVYIALMLPHGDHGEAHGH